MNMDEVDGYLTVDGSSEPGESEDSQLVSGVTPQAMRRPKRLLVAVLAVGAVASAALALAGVVSFRKAAQSESAEYVPFSHPAFVSYMATDAIPVGERITKGAPHGRVCDEKLVLETCQILNEESTEFHDNSIDRNLNYVHAVELSEVLMVSKSSVVELWSKLGLKDWDSRASESFATEAFAVSCQELCDKLVANFPPQQVPAASDVGCYTDPVTHATVCDVDVSPTALAKAIGPFRIQNQSKAYLETAGTRAFNHKYDSQRNKEIQKAMHAMAPTAKEQELVKMASYPDVDSNALRISMVNLFRIYPLISSVVYEASEFNQFFDIVPDEPGGSLRKKHSERKLGDINNDSCEHAKDGFCDEPKYCWGGTDCTDCNTCGAVASTSRTWKQETLEVAVLAKAYITLSLKRLAHRKVGGFVTGWFGNNLDNPTRTAVKRILAGVQAMLGNVDYIYPGEKCGEMGGNVYAYVYPDHPWNKNAEGQFIFHLCDFYMHGSTADKVETLTHEGSHHHMQSADDEVWQGETMYGRTLCREVAAECRNGNQEACMKTRNNADNICFFINDAGQGATVEGADNYDAQLDTVQDETTADPSTWQTPETLKEAAKAVKEKGKGFFASLMR